METQQYLTFHWYDLQYGIQAALVQEILPLPEINLLPEPSNDIIGILNLRGQIVPIAHLDLLQQHSLKECKISDYIIVIQGEDLPIGLLVNQANEVVEVNDNSIENVHTNELITASEARVASDITKVATGHILLLNPKTLIRKLDTILTLIWDAQSQLDGIVQAPIYEIDQPGEENQTSKISPSFYDLYCPNATLEERAIFRQRADNLRQQSESLNVTNQLMPLAVIGFGNEYFGLDLELVREFTDIGNLTPIPCCPNHIVGNMNLRGEIVTLVDIRNILNLPTSPVSVGSQAVVVQVDDIVAGLPVDQVLEMVDLNAADMTPLSGVLSDFGEQYIRGTAFFQERMLRVLDLPKIFTQGGLAVHEEA